jgi:hypothetical protein
MSKMLDPLRDLDAWLLDGYERAGHWFQRWTGRTCFWLYGRASLGVAGCWFFIISSLLGGPSIPWLGLGLRSHQGANGFWCFFAFLTIAAFTWDGVFRWKALEVRAFARLQRGLANPEKMGYLYRIFMVWWCGSCTLFDLLIPPRQINLVLLFLVSASYWRACDPLPPCAGKIFELWQAMFARKAEVPA